MTLAERQTRLIHELSIIPDRQERLSVVVERGRKLSALTPAEKVPANLVQGCVSPVWLVCDVVDGGLSFRGEAQSPLVKSLVTLLCEFYSRSSAADIVATEPIFLEELGFLRDLSPTRRNGLAAVRTRIRQLAQLALASRN